MYRFFSNLLRIYLSIFLIIPTTLLEAGEVTPICDKCDSITIEVDRSDSAFTGGLITVPVAPSGAQNRNGPAVVTITVKVKATEQVLEAGTKVNHPVSDANLLIPSFQSSPLPWEGVKDEETAHDEDSIQLVTDLDGNATFILPIVTQQVLFKTDQSTAAPIILLSKEVLHARSVVEKASKENYNEPVYRLVDDAFKEGDIEVLYAMVDSIAAQPETKNKKLKEDVLNYVLDKIAILEDPEGYVVRASYEQQAKNFPSRYGNQFLMGSTRQAPLMLRDFRIAELMHQKALLNLLKEKEKDAPADSVFTPAQDDLESALKRLDEIGSEIAELNRTMPYAINVFAYSERQKKLARIAELEAERDRILTIPGIPVNDLWRQARDRKIDGLIEQSKIVAQNNKTLESALEVLDDAYDDLFVIPSEGMEIDMDYRTQKYRDAEQVVNLARDEYLKSLNTDALLSTEVDGVPLWRIITEIEQSDKSDQEKHRLIDEALGDAIDRLDENINEQIAHLTQLRTFDELTDEFRLRVYDSLFDRAAAHYSQYYGPMAGAIFGAMRSTFQAQEADDEYWKLILRGGEAVAMAVTIPFPVVGLGVALVSVTLEGGRTYYVWTDLASARDAVEAGGLDQRSLYTYEQDFSTQRFAFGFSVALLPLDVFGAAIALKQAKLARAERAAAQTAKEGSVLTEPVTEIAGPAAKPRVEDDVVTAKPPEKTEVAARNPEDNIGTAPPPDKTSVVTKRAEDDIGTSPPPEKTEVAPKRSEDDVVTAKPEKTEVTVRNPQAPVTAARSDLIPTKDLNDLWDAGKKYRDAKKAKDAAAAEEALQEIQEIARRYKGKKVVVPTGEGKHIEVIIDDYVGSGELGLVFGVRRPDGTLIDDMVIKIFHNPKAENAGELAAIGQKEGAELLGAIPGQPIYYPGVRAADLEGMPPVLLLQKYAEGWRPASGKLTKEQMHQLMATDEFLTSLNIISEDGHLGNRLFKEGEKYAGYGESDRLAKVDVDTGVVEGRRLEMAMNPHENHIPSLEAIPTTIGRYEHLRDARNFKRAMWERWGFIKYVEIGKDANGRPIFKLIDEGKVDLDIVKQYDPDLVTDVYKRVGTDPSGKPIYAPDPAFAPKLATTPPAPSPVPAVSGTSKVPAKVDVPVNLDLSPVKGLIVIIRKAPGITDEDKSALDQLTPYLDHSFELPDHNFQALRFSPELEDAIRKIIEKIPNVERVEINFVRSEASPNDPYFFSRSSWKQSYDDQWAIKRAGFTAGEDSVWNLVKNGSPVTIAVIDTGLDWNHKDISWSNLWNNHDEAPGNNRDDDRNGYVDDRIGWNFVEKNNRPWDHGGHGTFVTGVIAAAHNNGIGIAGVSPNAQIMVLKALNSFGHTRASYIAEAIIYAANNGARVINLSLGGNNLTRTEQMAVDYAHSKGVVIVVAAGNEAIDISNYSPAGLNNVIAVAASDVKDSRAVYSNYGDGIDISAPGDDVLSLRARRTDLLRDIRGVRYEIGSSYVGKDKRYYRASGTSFAAPIVAGAASLLFSMNPKLSNEDVERMLLHSAIDLDAPGKDQHTGYGVLNMKAALKADPKFFLIPEIDSVAVVRKEGQPFVQVTGTADANQFQRGHIEIGAGKKPAQWKKINGELNRPVRDGVLGTIPAAELSGSREWTIRLVVEHQNGNAREGWFFLNLQ
ncbi:S8 family serine peptidase [bacterium]|nr:S8 family serine peptidase [bacterium]